MAEPEYRLVAISHEPRRYEIYEGGDSRGAITAAELCRRALCHEKLVAALRKIAELEGDCEAQRFRLTRFQAAQVARAALAAAAPAAPPADPHDEAEALLAALRRLLPAIGPDHRADLFRELAEDYCDRCGSDRLPCHCLG